MQLISKDDCFEVVELCSQSLQFWKEQNASKNYCHTPNRHMDSPANFWSCNHLSPTPEEPFANEKLLPTFRIVPQTQIYTLYHSYSMVFLLDVSSSLNTIDVYSKELLVDQVMETFRKCLTGITPSFVVPSSYLNEHFHFQPQLYISVLCDCTQIPAVSRQGSGAPTIRILLQNAVLTKQNLEETLAYVGRKFTELQHEMTNSYSGMLQQSPLQASYLAADSCQNRFLEAGMLSLRLLPQIGSSVLILITDGVAEFGRADQGAGLRAIAKEGVLLAVIQVGNSLGFTPSSSFGYIPDNESLRFLAIATGGKFIYSADCPAPNNCPFQTSALPNFYHRLFLIQETCFQKDRSTNRHASVNVGQERLVDLPSQRLLNAQPGSLSGDPLNDVASGGFPWTVQSQPPATELLLTRYRDYALPLETSCILNARLREGFFIERIILSGNRQNRAERIHVNMAMTWLPNVVIQYRIRAQLPSDFKVPYPNRKYIRIEMNILAPTVFAVSFVNMDATADSSSPLLANVASLHGFLRSIFATDDTLKSLNSILQQFPMLKAPRDRSSSSMVDPALIQKLDLDAIKSLWSSFENSRLDYISNGLFDHYSSILTAVTPTLGADFRLAELVPFLAEQEYHSISETTYIKYLYAQKAGQYNFPSFCILRLQSISDSLIWSRMVFVNVRYVVREALARKHTAIFARVGDRYLVRCCQRPLQYLLVTQPLNNDLVRRTDQLISSKDFLEFKSRTWLSDGNKDSYFPSQGLPTIHHLTFSLLIKAKLAQGFVRIGFQGERRQFFYKELDSPCNKCFGVQYQLEMDDSSVSSKAWAEPITGAAFENQSQCSIEQIISRDELVVSNLLAFDQIHQACRTKADIFNHPMRLRSLVLNSVALVSSYNLPMLCSNPGQDLLQVQRHLHILMRSDYFHPVKGEVPCSPLGLPLDYPLTFSLSEEEYLQLTPLFADLLLFQFFLESAIMQTCDVAVAAQEDDPCDTFVELIQQPGQAAPLFSSLKWGFAKKLSTTTFALIFVPSVKDLLKAYVDAYAHAGESPPPLTMRLWSYECIREDLHNPFQMSFNLTEGELANLKERPHYSNLYPTVPSVAVLHNTIAAPERVEFWTDWSKSQPNITCSVHALHSLFDAIHAKAFIQATYAAMLQGHAVSSSDISTVLSLCQVLTITVNLTDYLNLKIEKERRNLDQESRDRDESKLQHKFAVLIGYHFGAVATEGWNGTYFFKTPQKPNIHFRDYENLGSCTSRDNLAHDEPVSLPHLLAQASYPMFMTLNFCYTNRRCTPTAVNLVNSVLPSYYPVLESGQDFCPDIIGTNSSPLESRDGASAKIQLQLHVPLTFEQLCAQEKPSQAIGQVLTSDEFLKHANVDQLLPKGHTRALTETKSRLEWLIKEEVIHGLLTWSPITTTVLRWIDRKLSMRNPFVDFPSSFSMSLKFVDKAAGKEFFTRELEHIFIHPYCILRSGEYFYVQPIRAPAPACNQSSPSLLPQDSGMCGGLGISVAETSDSWIAVPNFWMLLVPTEEQVQISFFSKSVAGVERSRIIQRIRRKIALLLRQVNQIILLNELDSTRLCSRYLLPPDAGDDGGEQMASSGSESDGDHSGSESSNLAKALSISDFSDGFQLQVGPSKFRLGQFQCPLQFREVFALHWRIKPQMALNHILASVMHPLSVSNRQNLFVIRDSKSVFYMRLKETKLPTAHDPSDELLEDAIFTPDPVSPSFKRPSSSRHPPFSSGSSTVGPNTESRGLVLEVHGVYSPGREIKEELVSLIEGRLVGHLTLNIISSYLARNATLKLTQADVHFIFPIRQYPKPLASASYHLPSIILNPVLSLFYIKQNLLQYLHVLAGPEARLQYKQLCSQEYHLPSTATACECFFGDFTFFYNCIASRSPTPIEQLLGQGIGTVCLTLTDSATGSVLFQQGDKNLQHIGFKPLLAQSPLNLEPLIDGLGEAPLNAKFSVHADVWTVGSVDPEALLKQVITSIRQSMCDYILDCCTRSFINELSLLGDRRLSRTHSESDKDMVEPPQEERVLAINMVTQLVQPSSTIIVHGAKLSNPAMYSFQAQCALTSTTQKLLVTQIHDWLSEYNSHLAPAILDMGPNGQGEPVSAFRLAAEAFPSRPEENAPGTYFLFSGLPELITKHGRFMPWGYFTGSDFTPTRRSSSEDMVSVKSGKPASSRKDKPLEDLMLYPPNSHPHQCQKLSGARLELARSHFISVTVEGSCIKLHTANIARSFLDQLRGFVEKILAWQRSRGSLLDLIFQQKMGLFHKHYVIVSPLLPSPRNSASQSHSRGSLDCHRLGVVIRNPSPARVRTGIDVRAKPLEPQEPNDHSSLASVTEDPCKLESHQFCQINRVLAFSPPDASFTEITLPDTCPDARHIDYLQIHGQEFLDQYRKLLNYSPHELEAAQNPPFQAHSLFNELFNSTDPEDLLTLTRSCHLDHFCRTPLFHFKVSDTRSIDADLIFNADCQTDTAFINWYHGVSNQILAAYGAYLEKMGLQPNQRGPIAASSPLFYKKRIHGNLIVVKISIQSMLFCIDMHYMVLGIPEPPDWQYFLTECARLRASTHAHSFVYDFHLLVLQEWLDGQLDSIPKINIISLCSALLKSPLTRGRYSRNSLTSGLFAPTDFNAREIYHYIVRSPLRYGMRNIYCDNRPVGFFIAQDISNTVRRIIILTHSDTPEGSAFHYNDLLVHKDSFRSFPAIPQDIPPITPRPPQAIILAQLQEVLKLYHIDALWKQLQDNETELEAAEIAQLCSEFSHLDLIQLEPSFTELAQMGLEWHNALDSLILFHPQMCRGRALNRHPSTNNNPTMRHVLFFNPYDSHHLIYFRLALADGLQVSAVSRDPRAELKVVECEHVTSILRTLFYTMWQTLHSASQT
ncbi:hypothetical protein DSO57_1005373 [Entomophthora muscae]|uniref:Uncharacterized protein n=1 Tax=Entomophthora muscae TaxID=34485 RepID=A0ACC2S9Z5_9FUNG|nr:hypothetical protein DSO57_1005373 [Entomophthora muscae]